MKKILSVYKPVGKTPYEVIQQFKKQFSDYHGSSITYAGRLDPLAHGVLLLLVDEAIAEKEKYLSLPKTYAFEAVFGIETDSYDFLGLVEENTSKPVIPAKAGISLFIKNYIGKQQQSYPSFSSRTVNGKPLFWWTKQGRLGEIEIPTREIEIASFQLVGRGEITKEMLEQNVIIAVQKVAGDFRQEETITRWKSFFATDTRASFPTARFRITCSSGTYVRGLVNELGKFLGTGAVTSEILRTHVGEFILNDAMELDF